ncbi:hypothetical protein bcgnr5369_17160 [Bacillus cereus]
MKSFDIMSDIHLDFWVPMDHNIIKLEKKTKLFAESLIPDNPSRILIIPGDLGHYNLQNYWCLQHLSSIYDYVFLVFGNHDYYLENGNQKKKYKRNSNNRIIEMKNMTRNLENVFHLEGTSVEIDGMYYGGTGMWYDFQYGQQVQGFNEDELRYIWANNSNDYKKINGFLTLDKFEEEKSQLEEVIGRLDVVITHMGPTWDLSPYKEDESKHNSYYFFDGKEFFNDKKERIWCFGHAHMELDKRIGSTRFISHALGYPDEGEHKKFKQVYF